MPSKLQSLRAARHRSSAGRLARYGEFPAELGAEKIATRRVAGLSAQRQSRSGGWAQGRMVVHSWGGKLNNCDLWSPSSVWGRGCPVRVPSGTAPEDDFLCKGFAAGRQVEQLRPIGSREPPSPRAGLGAARHPKIGACFAKHRWRWPARGLGQVRTISAGDGQGGGAPLAAIFAYFLPHSRK